MNLPSLDQVDAELARRGWALDGDGGWHPLTGHEATPVAKQDLGDDELLPGLTRLAERLTPRLRRVLDERVRAIQGTLNDEQLRALWAARDAAGLERVLQEAGPVEFGNRLRGELASEFIAGADLAAQELTGAGLAVSFNQVNPAAVEAAGRRAASLIVQLTDDQRNVVTALVQDSLRGNLTVEELARQFRGTVGLYSSRSGRALPGSVQNVLRFRQRLEEAEIKPDLIARRVERFTKANLRFRHLNIARTEVLFGENAGQQALWRENRQNGNLPPETKRQWITTPDDRLDGFVCLPMEEQRVGIEEPFVTGAGTEVMHPPAHPSCRCAVGLVFPGRDGGAPEPGLSVEEARTSSLRALETSPVKSREELGGGANTSTLVTLANGQRAVFKPKSGEAPDLRREITPGTYYRREAAASDVAGLVGLDDLVPPTTIRTIGGEIGSVQRWVPNSVTARVAHAGEVSAALLGGRQADFQRAFLFNIVMGQTDRHRLNWMVNRESGAIALIDNGLTLPFKKRRFRIDYVDDAVPDPVVRRAPIPDALKGPWRTRWPEIEAALRARGIEDEAIALARGRRDRVLDAASWRDVLDIMDE